MWVAIAFGKEERMREKVSNKKLAEEVDSEVLQVKDESNVIWAECWKKKAGKLSK